MHCSPRRSAEQRRDALRGCCRAPCTPGRIASRGWRRRARGCDRARCRRAPARWLQGRGHRRRRAPRRRRRRVRHVGHPGALEACAEAHPRRGLADAAATRSRFRQGRGRRSKPVDHIIAHTVLAGADGVRAARRRRSQCLLPSARGRSSREGSASSTRCVDVTLRVFDQVDPCRLIPCRNGPARPIARAHRGEQLMVYQMFQIPWCGVGARGGRRTGQIFASGRRRARRAAAADGGAPNARRAGQKREWSKQGDGPMRAELGLRTRTCSITPRARLRRT